MSNTQSIQVAELRRRRAGAAALGRIRWRYLAKRVLYAVIAVWASLTIVFVLLHLSGDPVLSLAPETATAEQIELLREQLGFNQPLIVQYFAFLGQVLQGSFPSSLYNGQSAMTVVLMALPNSILLGAVGVTFAIVLGSTVGYYSVFGRKKSIGALLLNGLMLFQAMPNFLIAIILLLVFSLRLRWFPTSGHEGLAGLVLPAVAVGLAMAPNIARLFRTSLLDQAHRDYVNTARVKGLRESTIKWLHIVPNSLVPTITLVGLQIGALLGGIVVIETVFGWPGIGRLLIRSVEMHDFPVVISAVIIISITYVTLSLIVDLIVAALSPKGFSRAEN